MSEAFAVDFSDPAKQDLHRLFEFPLLRATNSAEFDRVQHQLEDGYH